MIPLEDETRRPSRFPIITVLLIGVNLIVFVLELAGGEEFVTRWSLVPADLIAGRRPITFLTSMFMHGGWLHIIGNMIYLWAFGPEIEDVMPGWRYPAFYLAGGAAATLAQVAIDPGSTIPSLGASGAIAAVMGAFLVTYPRDRIRTLLIVGWYVRTTRISAAVLIGFWFVIQLFSLAAIAGAQSGGVAYAAHVGGLVFGALAGRLFEVRARFGRS